MFCDRGRFSFVASCRTVAWKEVLESIKEDQPELYSVCVPDFIYRGWRYDFKSCGYYRTQQYKDNLAKYGTGINYQ